MMKRKNQKYVIGVDGGGTKTLAALADLEGEILKVTKSGPASPRNIGIKKTAENVAKAISRVLKEVKKGKILSTFIGLPSLEKEEYRIKKDEIKKEILKHKKVSKIKKGKVIIDSDQIVAFRSGTDEKEGIVLIAGTGCVCHGWRRMKDIKTSGWGYFNDEGSGFWVGQRGFQAILKDLDGRGKKTLITKLVFKKWKLKNKEDLLRKVYSKDFVSYIASMSGIIDEAAEKGDEIASSIMKEAGKELVLSTITVIKELNFTKEKFPLILVGKMFNSKIISNILKKEIKKSTPKVEFILPKEEPVMGAVKLAIENVTYNYSQAS